MRSRGSLTAAIWRSPNERTASEAHHAVLYAVAPPLFSFQAKHDVELEILKQNL